MFGFWIFLIVGTLAFEDESCVKNRTLFELHGDAILTVFTDLNFGPYCNVTSPKGIQELTTAFYIISKLSNNDYIPGITLGLKVIDTCQDTATVFKQALSLTSELECVDQAYSLGVLAPSFYTPVLQPFKDFTDTPIMFYSPQYITQTLVTIAVSFISTRFRSIDLLLTDSKNTFELFGNESAKVGICIKSLVDLEDKDNSGESLVVIAGDEFYIRSWMHREEVKSIQKTWIIIPLDNSDIKDLIPQGSFILSTETISPNLKNLPWENLENTEIHLPYLFSMGKPIISIINLFSKFQSHNCTYDSCSSSIFDYRALKDISNTQIFETLGISYESNVFRVSIHERLNSKTEILEEISSYEVDMNTFEIFAIEIRPKLNNCNEMKSSCDDCINIKITKTQKSNILDLDKKEDPMERIHLIKKAWVYILLSLIGCGTLICIGVSAYILHRFVTEDFLDGNPSLTFLLILGDIIILYSAIPFCLDGGDLDDHEYLNSTRIFVSTLSPGIVLAIMLSRSFFLAFSTQGVFSSHINGSLEGLMVFFVVGVQLAMSTMFFVINSTPSEDVLRSAGFIGLLSYDILLLLMLLGFTSFIWKIPRNYFEAWCFFITTIMLLIDWIMWIGLFCLVRPDWRDIIIAIGLISTAYTIIGGIILTRVYYMVTHLERKNNVRNHFENVDLRSEPRRRSFRQPRRPFHDYVLPMEGLRNPSVRFPSANPNYYGSSSPQSHQPGKIVGFNNYGFHTDIHEVENHYVVPNVCIKTSDTQKKRSKIHSDYAQPSYPIRDADDFDTECIETEIYVEGSRLSPCKKGPNESYPSRCSSPRLHPTIDEATINEEEEEIKEMTKITRF